MSGAASGDVRNCPECEQERALVMKQEGGKTRVYYQCLVCNPGWASRRATISAATRSRLPTTPLHPVHP